MEGSRIDTVRLITPRARLATEALAEEFPSIGIAIASTPEPDDIVVDAAAWSRADGFRAFDDAVDAAPRARAIAVMGDDVVGAAFEVLTRYQRHISRRNRWSATALFDAVLRAHRAIHRLELPLVRADHDHALDTWQWTLRLSPEAPLATQLAALLHDVERLESEAERRVEHHAPDYQAFKDAHAARGAERAFEVLSRAGVPAAVAARAREIIAAHERRGRDADVDLVNDADALSFFSLNSAGYLDYFGAEQTRRKVAYTLGRLGAAARPKLARARLRPDVARIYREAIGR